VKYALIIAALAALVVWVLVRRSARPSHGPRASFLPKTPYAGDYTGKLDMVYAPSPNGKPDPGEVVWTWVPYAEDHSRGKDRPVLLIGWDGPWLLALMLTTKDHVQNENRGNRYVDIGAGGWDPKRRPSEVKLDRILRISPKDIRREGSVVPQATFLEVRRSLYALHHW
jgi:hypothetical protein